MKLSACGYIARTVKETREKEIIATKSDDIAQKRDDIASEPDAIASEPDVIATEWGTIATKRDFISTRDCIIDILDNVLGCCELYPVWGQIFVKHQSIITVNGLGGSPLQNIIASGDDTIVCSSDSSAKCDGCFYSVSWDAGDTPHAQLGPNVGLCSATCRRVVYVNQAKQHLWEIKPNHNPVEFKLEYPLPLQITTIALGAEFTLALANCGLVWSWGINNHGQLGHGHIETVSEPTPIDYLGGLQIRSLAAGYWHSVALTDCDVAYSWGWNNMGQLGLSSGNAMEVDPTVLFDEDTEIVGVSCGRSHTVYLTSDKKLYGCGSNKYGQCDPAKSEEAVFLDNDIPSRALAENVTQFKCGPWSTYFVVRTSIT